MDSSTLTPVQKVKYLILARHLDFSDDRFSGYLSSPSQVAVDYEAFSDDDGFWDVQNEVREGEIETHLKCDWSRHYESKAVAAKLPDGSWVGWTYWYGGGKHGEPEAIDWIGDAYDLNCVEEEKLVVVRTFAKVEAA